MMLPTVYPPLGHAPLRAPHPHAYTHNALVCTYTHTPRSWPAALADDVGISRTRSTCSAARPPMRVSTGLHTTLLVGVLLRRLGHSDGHWPHGLEFGFHAPDRRSRAQSERSASCTDRTTARSRRLPPALAAAGPRGVKWCGPAPVTTCTASHGTCRPVPPPPPRIPLPRASSWAPCLRANLF